MAGVCEKRSPRSRVLLELPVHAGAGLAFVELRQDGIEPTQHAVRRLVTVDRERAEEAARLGHPHGGVDVMAGEVADDDRCAPCRRRNASYQSPPTSAASRAGTYRAASSSGPRSGRSLRMLRCSATANWACLA